MSKVDASMPTGTPEMPPGHVFDTLTAYQKSAALAAALKLGLFSHLAGGEMSAQQLATTTSSSVRGVRILCDYLVVQRFLSKIGPRYSNTNFASRYLSKSSDEYLGDAAEFFSSSYLVDAFRDVAQVVRAGSPPMRSAEDEAMWVSFARAMRSSFRAPARELAQLLPMVEGEARILDVAAGHGLYGVSVAALHPSAIVTALDFPGVLDVARETAELFGVAERFRRLDGDAFAKDFQGPYDIVLLSNFLHSYAMEDCAKIMKKVWNALAPGGVAAILGFIPNDDRVTPPPAAAFALTAFVTTAAGDTHTAREYEEIMSPLGFGGYEQKTLTTSPQQLLLARKVTTAA